MPWEIFTHDGQHCLRNQQTGKLVAGSCHASRNDTRKMQAAMYANVPEASKGEGFMDDSLTYYGGAVKALGDGRIGGYVALFTDDPDLQGDRFSKATRFYLESGDKRPIIYNHGLNKTVKDQQFGRGTVTIDDTGVWMEGELNTRDKYGKRIYEMVEKGAMGYSTGSASHLVRRTQQGKAYHLDSWPIVEVSLTPTPVEPRTLALPLKALAESEIEDLFEVKSADGDSNADIISPPQSSALAAVLGPAETKGFDAHSDAMVTAAEEIGGQLAMFLGAMKSLVYRAEDNARFRFEKDGRAVSKAKQQRIEALRAALAGHIASLKAVDEQCAALQRLFDTTQANEKAANEQARHELLRMFKITGHDPDKET